MNGGKMNNVREQNDRIKLAEAMGWTHLAKRVGWWMPPGVPESTQCWSGADELPDPFTDANDDYAVLEWMRTQYLWQDIKSEFYSLREHTESVKWLSGRYTWNYQIGDYARAALKVIDNE